MTKKKPRKLTDQESLVSLFARKSISSRSTFHPDQWSDGKEPADMIVQVGRAMLLFNMTASRSYLQSMVDHNLSQARDRLGEWAGGRAFRGKNEWRQFAIGSSDIDYVHVVSVVDGPHAACLDHPCEDAGMPAKVTLCTTVTSKVLRELAMRGGGARDLIALCYFMSRERQMTESRCIRILRKRYDKMAYQISTSVKEPTRLGPTIVNGRTIPPTEEYRLKFLAARQQGFEGIEAFADLSWHDVFSAIVFIVNSIAEMEWLENGQIRSVLMGEYVKFQIIVSTSMDALNEKFSDFLKYGESEGATFTYLINLTSFGAMEMFGMSKKNGPTATADDLRAIGEHRSGLSSGKLGSLPT